MRTLTISRARRATLGWSQLYTRQEGTWPFSACELLLMDAHPLPLKPCEPRSPPPHIYGPLWVEGCGVHKPGELHPPPLVRKYLLALRMHLNERLRLVIYLSSCSFGIYFCG